MASWDFSNIGVTFDNPAFTFDGGTGIALWTVDSTSVTTDSTSATVDGFNPPHAALAGAATDTTSAAGKLINFASVTLTAPLYTGVGGLFDPNLIWPSSAPVVGSVVYYDPTFITVLPDGEINSTSNNCTAEIQFNDGTNVNVVVIYLTAGLVGYARDTTAASGTLVTAAVLAAAATSLTSAVGSLTTGIRLASAAADLTTATGALTTAIHLAASATDASSGAATLGGAPGALAGAASDTTSANAALTTQIALAGAAADVMSAAGALTTQILLAGAATTASLASGALTTQASIGGAATDTESAAAQLSTQIQMGAAAADAITAAGGITTQIPLAGQAADTTSAAGSITTLVLMVGGAVDTSSGRGLLGSMQLLLAAANDVTVAAGSLITQIALAASATSSTFASGDLAGAIKLAAAAQTTEIASASLGVLSSKIRPSRLITTTFYSNNLLGTAGPLPYAEYFSRVGDVEIYAIDWAGWLTNFWERGEIVAPGSVIRPTNPTGYQLTTALGGQSGNAEPTWPSINGQTVTEGSVAWAVEPIDNTSLFATVVSAAWRVPTGIVVTGQEVLGQLVIAELDASGATPGQNYTINVATTMNDGESKVGQIVLKVR